MTDTEILEWLERNLYSMSSDRQTCSVDMAGDSIAMSLYNEARGDNGGPETIRIRGRSVRECVEKAMIWLPQDGRSI
jgi:hypothetical protein